MPELTVENSIFISIVLGLILAFFNFGGIFALVIVGFFASYLTRAEDTSYQVGALAAALLCLLYFVIGLFTPPTLPYQLPNPLMLGVGYAVDGLLTLMGGLIFSLLIYALLGAIGGYFAVKFFKPRDYQSQKRTSQKRKVLKGRPKPRKRSLYRK
jgi:hypothetical protein